MKTAVLKEASEFLPKYWPLTMFVYHNPLHEFENMHFKEALKVAQDLFDAKVYMPFSYYVDLYREGKVRKDILQQNIDAFLNKNNLQISKYKVRKLMVDIMPTWDEFKENSYRETTQTPPKDLKEKITADKGFSDLDNLLERYIHKYTFSQILDVVLDQNIYEIFYNDAIEFVSRFLDEGQTNLPLPFRDLGYWNCFTLHYNVDKSMEEILEDFEKTINPPDFKKYAMRMYINFFGWSSFIKFRESNPFYPYQEEYPISLEEFGASLFYIEKFYLEKLNKSNIKNYFDFIDFYKKNKEFVILKILKDKNILSPEFKSKLLTSKDYASTLNQFIEKEVEKEAKAVINLSKNLFEDEDYLKIYDLVKKIKEEEGYIWIKSLEESYAFSYGKEFLKVYEIEENPKAFAVFCVDVRSEAFRRNLERIDNYKTFGVAGFFGIKMALIEFDKSHELLLCPAMEVPERVILEIPQQKTGEYEKRKNIISSLKKTLDKLKNNPYTPFFTVESFGWLFGYNLFGKTLFPKLLSKVNQKIKPLPPKTSYFLEKLSADEIEKYTDRFIMEKIASAFEKEKIKFSEDDLKKVLESIKNNFQIQEKYSKVLQKYKINKDYYDLIYKKFSEVGFTLEEQAKLADNFLSLIGMVDGFPEFVLLVGHGSESDNNPYESALDCGACGGNSGYHNVRAMCSILNKKEVRELMKIKIPEETVFIPASHNTTTDEVEFYDETIPKGKEKKWQEIKNDFYKASKKTRIERLSILPYADTEDDIVVRAIDWSEMRPEWGLSKNVGVFVGKRETSMNSVLSNRFFMHSYDYRLDPDNTILKRILNGPFLIAQWINAEYYFSTVDNEKFGSGSKVYHNVVSRLGVFSGNYSDLRLGLPYQTVYYEDKPFHEPIRLVVFVEAPLEKVIAAASETEHPMTLLKNEWVRLVVIDREKNKLFLLSDGNFVEL
ncbi:putative inorganic carbon transporter subunit DabA [Sulfurihydrogenibium sp.]|uniref:putative inorganic carbon transporter subunit DabA n=1 Tax=Sulfurihydrogenibium sp. TaxID=2053621 RepID=UPI0026260D95|nr:putative inorganic carbon transporter subunit DabA [Sulfurihydrogenibium sp.]